MIQVALCRSRTLDILYRLFFQVYDWVRESHAESSADLQASSTVQGCCGNAAEASDANHPKSKLEQHVTTTTWLGGFLAFNIQCL